MIMNKKSLVAIALLAVSAISSAEKNMLAFTFRIAIGNPETKFLNCAFIMFVTVITKAQFRNGKQVGIYSNSPTQ